MFVLLATV